MTPQDQNALDIGRLVIGMVGDLQKIATFADCGIVRQKLRYGNSPAYLIVVSSGELVELIEETAKTFFKVQEVKLPPKV